MRIQPRLNAIAFALLASSTAPHVSANEAHASVREANTLVPAQQTRYAPSIFPDRVTLLPTAQPATSHNVTWRTNTSVEHTIAQITPATASPGLHLNAIEFTGSAMSHTTPNGEALHHRVTFSELQPDTLYAYRVKGGDTWSEWHQFRTPQAEFAPYTALYFGDAQNAVLSHYARTVREAFRATPHAKVMLYAGDLVNSREDIHDNEWGEWFQALSWIGSTVTQIPSSGNHEFSSDDDNPIRHLLPHWAAQFELPNNGPEGLQDTVYYTDYQGVRYIALDSTEALQSPENAEQQAEWLEQVLSDNPQQWTVIFHHHPMHSVSKGRDNPPLREFWQPVYEAYNVDLVLQGHDHTYGRDATAHQGKTANDGGPVYAVSVAGPKQYLVSDHARATMDRVGEDTQLFQVIDFEQNEVRYQAFTVTGELYDAFSLKKAADGSKTFVDQQPKTAPNSCANPNKPKPSRCWNGTDVIHAPAAKVTP